jgi:hypothetical protein
MSAQDGCRARRGRRWVTALMATGALVAAVPAAQLAAPPAGASGGGSVLKESHGSVGLITGPLDATRAAACSTGSVLSGAAAVVNGITPGRIFSLTADAGTWQDDFDVAFSTSLADCQAGVAKLAFTNHAGDEHAVVPAGAGVAIVTLASGKPPASFTYREYDNWSVPVVNTVRKPTVVAIIEPVTGADTTTGFSPYHADFLGRDHPWNTDSIAGNDIDFNANPATYIPGYPGANPLNITLPASDSDPIAPLYAADASTWTTMTQSTPGNVHPYWLPGTKVIAAVRFSSALDSSPNGGVNNGANNTAHGTETSSVSAGNIHGTCPECLLVWIGAYTRAEETAAIDWAASQPWIDVISNSYVRSTAWYDGLYLGSETSSRTKSAVQDKGKIVVWAGGNGDDGAFLVNDNTYTSSQNGPDWVVTVGAIAPTNDQPLRGGLPVDISAYGGGYPAAGGTIANGETAFSGSSNATPVVAGTMARMIQWARDATGDTTTPTDPQVVAQGQPVACAANVARCPLDDGVLTRTEVEQTLFDTVLPSPPRPLATNVTATAPSPTATAPDGNQTTAPSLTVTDALRNLPAVDSNITEGHGIVYGRAYADRYTAEQRQLQDVLFGAANPPARPPAEPAWFVADSKCRQRLWGVWSMGLYTGTDPVFNPAVDQTAMAWNAACSQFPQDFLANAPDPSTLTN